jgi:hypothetical protein
MWIVCRRMQQIPIPDLDVLPRWIELGKLRPDDYLVNPTLEICIQAREDPGLNAIFLRRANPVWRGLVSFAARLLPRPDDHCSVRVSAVPSGYTATATTLAES